ncbi:hypothetical protein [Polyangium aurulentum]|uniref:hypothetical protein n=1 Tax=Polyangium aurulentum TaxID=2567896 RepID=UPI0010ADB31F|nr:hypothetical protein [Polyangium aurulentum]UQA57243.1 hypothetical protein E8A73_039050 [Polyangium aurulentum]
MTERLAALVDEAFPRAVARWSPFLLLARPAIDPDEEKLPARVNLRARTLTLGAPAIEARGLEGALEALLAHEIGHLVAFPGTLVAEARLRLLERTFLPRRARPLTGVFHELLINERLGGALEEDLCAILSSHDTTAWRRDPAFVFHLAVHEELWQRPPGELMGEAFEAFEAEFPGYRADAQLLAQNLFALAPNVTLQFLYFMSIALRYAIPPEGERAAEAEPECAEGEPSPEEWAEALVPQAAEKQAVRRAIEERWFPQEIAKVLAEQGIERRSAAMPGQSLGRSGIAEVMAAHYRREAERFLFKPPPVRLRADELVPTTLDDWEPGDPVGAIDWVATLIGRGETLGAAMPMTRERMADEEGLEDTVWQGRTEIYLDVSGSMPDPTRSINAMTLAAQILAMGTLRAGGAARALVYSTEHESHWTFCRSERILSRFLMSYIGGGTEFPFDVLNDSVEEQRREQPVRIIITDRDFDGNYDARPENAPIFARAAARSPALVLLLHAPDMKAARRYEAAGAKVVPVRTLDDFPRMAAALSFSLFDRPAEGPRH